MSLTLSREVLMTRNVMQARADGAMQRIQNGISQAEYTHAMLQDMKIHKEDLDANKDYSFTKIVPRQHQIPLAPSDTAYQFCTVCNQLCCQLCPWPQSAVQ